MSDESEPITAVAKAVEETAKAGRALVEAGSSDLARFLGKALGTAAEDTVGLLGGDYLHELRLRNLDKISRKTEEILRERGVEDTEPIGPKALLPALGAASEEIDETLQDMWANLLANAMDPNKDTSLQRVFTEALKQFEPIDALVLDAAVRNFRDKMFGGGGTAELISKRSSLASISAEHLAKLGCFLSDPRTAAAPERKRNYSVSNLGTELHLACTPDAPD